MGRIDLTGKMFNRWLVVKYSHTKNKVAYWNVRCVCGNDRIVSGVNIRHNKTKSCGCLRKLNHSGKTHGLYYTTSHSVWRNMKTRCNNPKSDRYKWYGRRGIKVCKRWELFENFYADMGEKPKGLTLERIDNNKGYSKKNCKWATHKEQANNRRTSRILTLNGVSLTIAQWSEKLNILPATICNRINKSGWSVQRTLTEAVKS